MTSTTHQAESSRAALYVAFELSVSEWGTDDGHHAWGPDGAPCGSAWAIAAALTATFEAAGAHPRAADRHGPSAAATKRGATAFGRIGCWRSGGRERGGGLVEHRGLAPRQARQDRPVGWRPIAAVAVAAWAGGTGDVAGGACPDAALEDRRHAIGPDDAAARANAISQSHSACCALHGARARLDQTLLARLAAIRDWAGEPLRRGCRRGSAPCGRC